MARLDTEQERERVRRSVIAREPMALIDRLLEVVPGQSARSLKNVGANEPFFAGHFPGQPVLPGVLILEAMRQTIWSALAVLTGVPGLGGTGLTDRDEVSQTDPEGTEPVLLGVESARFRRPVLPGDQLVIQVERDAETDSELGIEGERGEQRWQALASVNQQMAAQAVLRVGNAPKSGASMGT